jgi:hypothetical protein
MEGRDGRQGWKAGMEGGKVRTDATSEVTIEFL